MICHIIYVKLTVLSIITIPRSLTLFILQILAVYRQFNERLSFSQHHLQSFYLVNANKKDWWFVILESGVCIKKEW